MGAFEVNPTPAALVERFQRARGDPEWAVLEGFHALKHAVRFGAAIEVACTPDAASLAALAARPAPDLAGVAHTPRRADPANPVRAPDPALAKRPAPDLAALLAPPFAAPVVLLEAPADHGNLGAVVRVGAAAGAGGVLTTGRLDPWHPIALRGSAGLHYALPVVRLEDLPDITRPLLAIDPGGAPLRPEDLPDDAVLAFGAERRGLSPALLARAARILALPMRPGVSSLNLATAVASVLYAWRLA